MKTMVFWWMSFTRLMNLSFVEDDGADFRGFEQGGRNGISAVQTSTKQMKGYLDDATVWLIISISIL